MPPKFWGRKRDRDECIPSAAEIAKAKKKTVVEGTAPEKDAVADAAAIDNAGEASTASSVEAVANPKAVAAHNLLNAVKECQIHRVKALINSAGEDISSYINGLDQKGYGALHYAVAKLPISKNGFSKPSAEITKMLLAVKGINIELRDAAPRSAATPLYHAVASGTLATMEALLSFSAPVGTSQQHQYTVDINALSMKCTPLGRAALAGDVAKVKLLLGSDKKEKGEDMWPCGAADPTVPSATGITPLHCAADQANIEILQLLLADERVNVNARSGAAMRTPFMCAVSPMGQGAAVRAPEVVKLLLGTLNDNKKEKERKTRVVDVTAANSNGQTALHIAATWGQHAVIPLLLAVPALDVNAKDKDGNTALHAAVGVSEKHAPHAKAIKALLSPAGKAKGIDVSIVNNAGKTALEMAKAKNATSDVIEAIEEF